MQEVNSISKSLNTGVMPVNISKFKLIGEALKAWFVAISLYIWHSDWLGYWDVLQIYLLQCKTSHYTQKKYAVHTLNKSII